MPVQLDIEAELAVLAEMSPAQLREKYLQVFGERSRSGNKDFLRKRLAWRIQSLAEGTLSDRARQRAAELARDADIRTTIPRALLTSTGTPQVKPSPVKGRPIPLPGTVLTRQYQGKQIRVTVLPNGFDCDGTVYRSLSAVARAVTGTRWNGHLFFGLRNGDDQ